MVTVVFLVVHYFLPYKEHVITGNQHSVEATPVEFTNDTKRHDEESWQTQHVLVHFKYLSLAGRVQGNAANQYLNPLITFLRQQGSF